MEGAKAVPAHRPAAEMTFPRIACTTLAALLMGGVEGRVLSEIRASQQPGPNRVEGWPEWRGANRDGAATFTRSEEHTSELQSQSKLVCRLLRYKKNKKKEK